MILMPLTSAREVKGIIEPGAAHPVPHAVLA